MEIPDGSIGSSPSQLDIRGAAIQESFVGGSGDDAKRPPAPSITLPNQDADFITHIALDIGGSLIKLVYFSPDDMSSGQPSGSSARGGRLHFVKFESSRIEDAIAFIEAKGLHKFKRASTVSSDGTKDATTVGPSSPSPSSPPDQRLMRVISTGGGAFKYADLFKSRLGVVLESVDEMLCLVDGCNFLLKAIRHEAFTYENQATSFVPTDNDSDIFPYLLVNIGSGVSMVKVEGEGQFERVSGSSLGGGTFWGLSRLLTGKKDFDEVLELSMQGDNANVDMLVGDIYGGRDYSTIGLSATTIASSFGKVISNDRELEEYEPSDISMALCRMISYNIGQLAYLNAMRYNIKRIFFGGFFIRGHPYTMDTIAYAIRFWSKGEMAAHFLRHEGFLGAVGAFLKVHPMASNHQSGATQAAGISSAHLPCHASDPLAIPSATASAPSGPIKASQASTAPSSNTSSAPAPALAQPGSRKVRSRFVERFSMGAPFSGGSIVGPAIDDLEAKVSWVEKFVQAGAPAVAAAQTEHAAAAHLAPPLEDGFKQLEAEAPSSIPSLLNLGSLQPLEGQEADASPPPSSPPLPQLSRPASSLPWSSLSHGSGAFVRSAGGESAVRMALHVGVLHYTPSHEQFPLLTDPMSYEPNTFDINATEVDAPESSPHPASSAGEVRQTTFEWWLKVLEESLPTLIEKAIASEGGTDSSVRRATAFSKALKAHLSKLKNEPGAYGRLGLAELFEMREECLREFGFSDVYRLDKERENAAALSVLPDLLNELDAMEPDARLLTLIEGCLASNIFDWGAKATISLYHDGTILDMYRTARQRMGKRPWAIDHFDKLASRLIPTKDAERPSTDQAPYKRVTMFVDNAGADVVLGMLPLARELLRMGCEVVMVANSLPAINDITASELKTLLSEASTFCPILGSARQAAEEIEISLGGRVPPFPGAKLRKILSIGANLMGAATGSSSKTPILATAIPHNLRKLYVVSNGQGSPCIDFRRVPDVLADACIGTDLVIIEGMGRAIHTNLGTSFRCDSLKLAMIKTEWLAKKLFGPGGALFDCVCAFNEGKEG